jgi:UPF0176 protein
MALYNTIDGKLLKEKLKTIAQERTTLSFYKYHPIENPKAFRDELYASWINFEVWGRIYVAKEGINAQLSVASDFLSDFKSHLESIPFLKGVRLNLAIDDNGKSFFKLKIQVRNKIVADGLTDDLFNSSDSGKHLTAHEYNQLTDEPQTVVVDMRNHYESEVGHFREAICPDVDTFREALPAVNQLLEGQKEANIVMYCTGGIRCEKASAWFKHQGYKNVFQLDGGIIEYSRQVKAQGLENKFVGKNFVFDERLGERISEEVISVCHQCGRSSDAHTNCRNEACHLLFIQCENCSSQFNGCCSVECQEIISLPEEVQQQLRKGKAQGQMIYKKSRSGNIKFRA